MSGPDPGNDDSGPSFGGDCDAGWGPLRDRFTALFDREGDVGAAVAVYHRDRPVVNLRGGFVDAARTRPWGDSTIVGVFSTTKGVTAICANRLIERGLLDPDAPVADYWPEFAAAGKETLPVRWLLSHRAGLAAVDGDLSLDDVLGWDGVVAAIADQAPNWEPGTAHGYHARSFGWTVGEVIRRITGHSVGTMVQTELAVPLGLRFWIGLPAEEERNCADLIPDPGDGFLHLFEPDHLIRRVLAGPSDLFAAGYDESWNRREMRAAEMPSSNGIGDAGSLARLYAATIGEVDGVRVLAPATVSAACEIESTGPDLVTGMPLTFGRGFMVGPAMCPTASPTAFGHAGAGGSLALADPALDLGFAYVMNQLRFDPAGDRRASSLLAAAMECAEKA